MSEAPDLESDVAVTFSLHTYRLVCLRCSLSKDARAAEAETADAMMRHLDTHRAAGDWVPDSLYDGLRDCGFDDDIRRTYACRGRGDGDLSVSIRDKGRRCLSCSGCKLNRDSTVECYTTDDMLRHLDGHQTRGYPVSDHVYEVLRRDQVENDEIIQSHFDERGVARPSAPHWAAPETLRDRPDPVLCREALDQLSPMVEAAIARFKEPISSSERSVGWNDVENYRVVDALYALSGDVETAKRDADLELGWLSWHIADLFFDPIVPSGEDDQRWEVLQSIWRFIGQRAR